MLVFPYHQLKVSCFLAVCVLKNNVLISSSTFDKLRVTPYWTLSWDLSSLGYHYSTSTASRLLMCQEDQTSMYEIPAEKKDTTNRRTLTVTYEVSQGICTYRQGSTKSIIGSGTGLIQKDVEKSWSTRVRPDERHHRVPKELYVCFFWLLKLINSGSSLWSVPQWNLRQTQPAAAEEMKGLSSILRLLPLERLDTKTAKTKCARILGTILIEFLFIHINMLAFLGRRTLR